MLLNDTTQVVTHLEDGGSYYWRVTAEDGENETTDMTTYPSGFFVDLSDREFRRGFSLWAPPVDPKTIPCR